MVRQSWATRIIILSAWLAGLANFSDTAFILQSFEPLASHLLSFHCVLFLLSLSMSKMPFKCRA